MISRWFKLKDQAIKLRKEGTSIGVINKAYRIPKSTLSCWFRKIQLSKRQKDKIYKEASIKMDGARKKALLWHHSQKANRIKTAKNEADLVLEKINADDKSVLELALSFLYLGEGSKLNETSIGNANPLVLKFFINAIKKLYPNAKLGRCQLHLRSDQNELSAIKYWSKELNINEGEFSFVKDKRIAKTKTYQSYHGVCVIRFTEIAIQRRLLFLCHKFCNIISEMDS
ncbi:MAG: hypothetical protein UR39_C0016G0013 [Candidatus Woesebacteria bacterium GW2011_GWA1_33_30]|uniref:HTH psq-type domain-containing protein n=1 Tax=Candidatus Woesebacteria bacterium GW2011_GWA2_33_28 TaxID=1618561 RepID=A0A0F9ZUT0_9BACT|nr:MAG: hypothetical protein UR39_C0016G0013 [Candidatus Woesebacteria bacterium GW2011_GWA1_33_30]KKP48093.1 MAG: hypothetical protein UR38_C0002G0196 [Candidatus Woesebacteria bacterium GW2011_GWA2_33_28]KKP50179.1 MAG: hypothetical protein UR40_C0002G0196 [Microgenomates group bacterium GW2011_GWC1_33_32]KKP51949.1 MAG: hypothetical protein UR44_C0006G0195 [Candidatus Woesebacteria bacterium GW2011_GWB1_33_38]KKP58264.1 MAG: hypothetical protein UR48_C0006G0013 [Microgenomates group bacteriu